MFGFLGGYYIGRQKTLMIAAFLAVLGAALNTGASSATGLRLMYSGRVFIVSPVSREMSCRVNVAPLQGLGVGMSTNMVRGLFTPSYAITF